MINAAAHTAPHERAAGPLRVLVVDDQLPFRTAIRRVLRRASTLEVIAEASDGAEAVALTGQLHPDIVLLDVRMPGMDGPTAARIIAERWPEVSVVLCSSHAREDLPADLAAPYVAKELLTADVLLAAAGRG
jgi:DNA-binding NarL/FixJ family response regulator